MYRVDNGKYSAATGSTGYLWLESAHVKQYGKEDYINKDFFRALVDEAKADIGKYVDPEYGLQIGDMLVMEHPGRHIAMYVGTLRMYGYTEEEVPQLAGELDTPLVMHCSVNASIADRFAYLLENGRPVYRYATVTDGGVCISLLCDSAESAPMHVFQQKQDTYYYLLPDDTWLTVLSLEGANLTCWVRLRKDPETADTAGTEPGQQ